MELGAAGCPRHSQLNPTALPKVFRTRLAPKQSAVYLRVTMHCTIHSHFPTKS